MSLSSLAHRISVLVVAAKVSRFPIITLASLTSIFSHWILENCSSFLYAVITELTAFSHSTFLEHMYHSVTFVVVRMQSIQLFDNPISENESHSSHR